ncbi:MAG: hypothetical protein MZV70_07535 [Desulfobacterales bacterium]|nr:hypothetical protein [Desulfobacterales bacterium]
MAGRRNGQRREIRMRPCSSPLPSENHPSPQRPAAAPGLYLRSFRRGHRQRLRLLGLPVARLAPGKCTQAALCLLLPGTGLGKSHLSQAIGHHILSQVPGGTGLLHDRRGLQQRDGAGLSPRRDRQVQDQVPDTTATSCCWRTSTS